MEEELGTRLEDHGTTGNGGLPSAQGAISRLAYARAKEKGVPLEPLLKGAGLTVEQMENPNVRLKVRDQIRFLNLVSDALRDEYLGFHLAQLPDLREFGLIYYVLASADTLDEAARRGSRYSSLVNEGISLQCIDGARFGISLRYVGVNRHHDRHQIEFWFVEAVRIFRKLTGLHLLPERVRFTHHRDQRSPEFPEFFGNDIKFGASVDEITYAPKTKDLPIVSADPHLNKLLVHYCEEALAHRHISRSSFRSSVENAVVPLLPHGKARASEIARRLGIGQRTFARRLSSEGLTFSDLLEGLRFDLAIRYLSDKNLSISQVAWLLGYQEVGGFSHAFKRWSGKTPREVRSAA